MGDLNTRNPIVWFFLACFVISIVVLGWLLSPYLPILVIGAVISGISYPVFAALRRRFGGNRALAAFVTCFIIFNILFVPTVFFVGSLAQQAFGLYEMAKGAAINEQINTLLRDTHILDRVNGILANFNYLISGEEIKQGASEIIRFVGFALYQQARAIASNTLAFVINFFLMLLVIYYLLIDGEHLVAYIMDLSPLPTEQDRMLIGKFNEMVRAIMIGNGLGGLIQGSLGGFLFWCFGFQSASLWGVIMGFLAFMPIIGIGAVFIPTVIYLFLKGRIAVSIFFMIYYLALSGGTEYFFKPRVVGKRVKMHPLLVFFAIIGGLTLFGFLGIIYGPLIVTAFLTMADIYRANYQRVVESSESEG